MERTLQAFQSILARYGSGAVTAPSSSITSSSSSI